MTKRRICVVTTSRADYGLLHWLMKAIDEDPALELQVVATGMHLCPEFGLTYRKIEEDGFAIARKVEMVLSGDTEASVVKSVGVGLMSFAVVYEDLKPDIVVVLGDRYELFSVTIPALLMRIPIAHIHGGETSQGAADEAVRHSLTKMASIHFPATEEYRKRIIQMGEDPRFVFNFGAPGLDWIQRLPLLKRAELGKRLDFDLSGKVAMVTYHPVTLEGDAWKPQIEQLLRAIQGSGIKAIFTKANADAHGRMINLKIGQFCEEHPERFRLYDNLGQVLYLSCVKNLDLMIGNSSSGIVEAPSFRMPVVNIGDRQRGRIKAGNVIDVGNSENEIHRGIERAVSESFRREIASVQNPYDKYGDGKVSDRIKETLKKVDLSSNLLKKTFFDIDFNA